MRPTGYANVDLEQLNMGRTMGLRNKLLKKGVKRYDPG